MTVSLDNGQSSATVTINDTSVAQSITPTFSNNQAPINEGDTITITWTGTNIPDGTVFNYKWVADTANRYDIDESWPLGSFTMNNNTATVSITTVKDLATEGQEQLMFEIVSPAQFQDAWDVVIADTSVTPSYSTAVKFVSHNTLAFDVSASEGTEVSVEHGEPLRFEYQLLSGVPANLQPVQTIHETTFKPTIQFDNLVPYTDYFFRFYGVNLLESTQSVLTPWISAHTDQCADFAFSRGLTSLSVSASPNTLVTITEELSGGTEIRGLTRPIADDEFGNLFLAVGEGQFRSPSAGPGGKIVFDTGFLKWISYVALDGSEPDVPLPYGQGAWWYDTDGTTANAGVKWDETHKAAIETPGADIYSSTFPDGTGLVYNILNYIKRKDNPTGKVLYINDYKDSLSGNKNYSYYGPHKFKKMFQHISTFAGFTLETPPENNPGSSSSLGNVHLHNAWLETGYSTKEDYLTFLEQYDLVIWFSTNTTGYLPQILVDAMLDFYDGGGGMFISTDHDLFQGCANQLVAPYGIQFTGKIDRDGSDSAYQISTILNNSAYLPSGYHPLFQNLRSDSTVPADVSEGLILYNDGSVPLSANPPPVGSYTSTYTTDSNGELVISQHNNGTDLGDGKIIISTGNECGGQSDGPPGDMDFDGLADDVDPDRDGDGVLNEDDADPDNQFVFTGDADQDGVDTTIDPDDSDPDVGIFQPEEGSQDGAKFFMNYKYRNHTASTPQDETYAHWYKKNVTYILPAASMGCLLARVTLTTSASTHRQADQLEYMNPRTVANPSTYTDHIGRTGPRDDYDPYPVITGIPAPTFFRVSVPVGANGWSGTYNYEFNIAPVPYFDQDGMMFAMPFEWAGYYPLYATEAEAIARSPSGTAHSHTFSWDQGTQNDAAPSVSNYPMWNHRSLPVTKTFYMPDGLIAATNSTPDTQYLTHFWHGNHPGLPVWSKVSRAGTEEGYSHGHSFANGMVFEWQGPQGSSNAASLNLATNTNTTFDGTLASIIYPRAVRSDTLTAIKEAIPVTVT